MFMIFDISFFLIFPFTVVVEIITQILTHGIDYYMQ